MFYDTSCLNVADLFKFSSKIGLNNKCIEIIRKETSNHGYYPFSSIIS